MKFLDSFLRAWRTQIALKAADHPIRIVLDIGCGDDYLLGQLHAEQRLGIDPGIKEAICEDSIQLFPGRFPDDIRSGPLAGAYDAVFALAVFEHLREEDFSRARALLPDLLNDKGRLIVTVPHPFVDEILDILIWLRLIDGQAVHEHHGFNPERILDFSSDKLRLLYRKRFQLGLNNLFVFERI